MTHPHLKSVNSDVIDITVPGDAFQFGPRDQAAVQIMVALASMGAEGDKRKLLTTAYLLADYTQEIRGLSQKELRGKIATTGFVG